MDGDGSGLAASVKQRATLEVSAVGATECWRRTERDSVQRRLQKAGGKQRRSSAIKDTVGRAAGTRAARGGL